MEGFWPSLLSFTFVAPTPTKQFQWIASGFLGIIFCKLVYELTASISSHCFKRYQKLSNTQKVEWNNRGFSTFHAFVVALASFYLLVISDLFKEDSRDTLIINRTSTLSDTTFGFSLGYFLMDLAMIFWYYPALGGLEYVVHHGLSMFAMFLSLISGQAQMYILMTLFSEITTPFVNLRWFLDVGGEKGSTVYILNGFALFFGWLIARVVLFIYLFVHMYGHFDEVKQIFALGRYSLVTVPSVLAMMNVYWFWKIIKGLVKTVNKARGGLHLHGQ